MRCRVEMEGDGFVGAFLVEWRREGLTMQHLRGQVRAGQLFKGDFKARSAGKGMGERWWVQLFDFLSCSFEASMLNRKKKNNPLFQAFVAQALLFPPKPKENGQDSFCPESICVFYIGLGFEVLRVKWEKRQRFLSI